MLPKQPQPQEISQGSMVNTETEEQGEATEE